MLLARRGIRERTQGHDHQTDVPSSRDVGPVESHRSQGGSILALCYTIRSSYHRSFDCAPVPKGKGMEMVRVIGLSYERPYLILDPNSIMIS